jgi:PAS domain S-box-containing protein
VLQNERRHLMASAVLIGLSAEMQSWLQKELHGEFVIREHSADGPSIAFELDHPGGADVVLVGAAVNKPVDVVHAIHATDKELPVVILSDPTNYSPLAKAIMFSPFVGREVVVWPLDQVTDLPRVIREVASHRHQRRTYRKTMARAQMQVGQLTLHRRDVTRYLDRLLDYAPLGVLTISRAGAIRSMNPEAARILHIGEREGLGASIDAILGQEWKQFTGVRQRGEKGRNAPEVLQVQVDGATRFVEATSGAFVSGDGESNWIVILQDVTNRVCAEAESARAEEESRVHAEILRSLHQIVADQELSVENKIKRLIVLGCERFKVQIGALTRIEGQQCRVLEVISSAGSVPQYESLDTRRVFCGYTVQRAEPLAISNVGASEWKNDPCHLSGVEAYIGTRVLVNGKVFGTLSFFSLSARSTPFTSTDLEVLKLMAQWIGSEMHRQEAERHMRMLSQALEQADDLVMIADRERRIQYVNPSFERLTGYPKEEVIGEENYFQRSGMHDQSFYEELWKTISGGDIFRGMLINKKKDGGIYYEEKTITPLRDTNGCITHFISTGHDVTERIAAEQATQKHQAELAHVARLSTLGEMTTALAHELNQPLCAVTTYAQTCLRAIKNSGFDPTKLRYGLEQIVKQIELAGQIFRRLRDFSRKNSPHREAVNVRSLIREVAKFMRAELEQQRILLRIEAPGPTPLIKADPVQIEQVLLNLVRNSIEAVVCSAKDDRKLTIRSLKNTNGSIKVSIGDSGYGVPPELATRLFEPFFTTKSTGLGIGLSISQNIIEAHGGRLWLESNSEAGAVFSFTLPHS